MNSYLTYSIPVLASLLAACAADRGAATSALPMDCEQAAASVAANNPVRGTTLRISKAQSQAATPTVRANCLVEGAMNERVSAVDGKPYAIKFRLRMPQLAEWNGKFYMEGGGGSNGVLSNAFGLAPGTSTNAFARGYAVIATDSGHDIVVNFDANNGGGSAFGRDPQARIDFGYNSYDVVTQVGKAIVAALYARKPAHSYFMGCSEGGREAQMMSQRFPTHYDGISAGAPPMRQPYMASYSPYLAQTLVPVAAAAGYRDAQNRPLIAKLYTDADFQLVSNAILDACDSLDGLKDGISSNLGACTDAVVVPKLSALTCQGTKTASCLMAEQIGALRKAYAGPKTSAGVQLYPSQVWDPAIGGMNGTTFNQGFRRWWFGTYDAPTNDAIKLTLSGPGHMLVWQTPPVLNLTIPQYFDYALTYNLDETVGNMNRKTDIYAMSPAEYGFANSTDLSKLKQSGGKLLVWIGNADPAVSVNETIEWYNKVNERQGGKAADFARLFTVPGMNHCSGGPSTDKFDMLTVLENWVERGMAPDSIPAEASNPGYFGVAARSRPLCPYPKYAHYNGSGDINLAESFICK